MDRISSTEVDLTPDEMIAFMHFHVLLEFGLGVIDAIYVLRHGPEFLSLDPDFWTWIVS